MHVLKRMWIMYLAPSCGLVAHASGQDADSAKTFVESLYRQYTNHGKGINLSGRRALNYFTASLSTLIDADGKAAGPDQVGVLDGNPICSCQDWDGI